MQPTPPVPRRRHDPSLQNFIYKGDASPEERRKDEERLYRIAEKVRQALEAARRNGAS